LIGPVVQESDQLTHVTQGVKDVAAAGRLGPCLRLTGTQATPGIGDGRVGSKTVILQLQQPDGPGVGVAVLFGAE